MSREEHTNIIADRVGQGLFRGTRNTDIADEIYCSFLSTLAARVREVNEDNGWFDDERTFGEGVALLHSEVSEMLEAWRDHGTADATPIYDELAKGLPKPEGVGSEAADVLIRLLDECDRAGIDLQAEFDRKLAYNATRGNKHGGKRL